MHVYAAVPYLQSEAKRLEALRYFEEVDVHHAGLGLWFEVPRKTHHPDDTRTYRGAFERYQRLGVSVYAGGG